MAYKEREATTATLLEAPVTPSTVELMSETLPLWREQSEHSPVLVLMSQDPFLHPAPPSLAALARKLVQQGHPQTIRRQGGISDPDPVFLPQMSVRLALESRFFSTLVWILPTVEEPGDLNLDVFREQLSSSGLLTENELASLQKTPTGFSGTLANTPFLAVSPRKLPPLNTPVVLHMDLSYFRSLYQNEIKTPIYELLRNTLVALRKTGWKTLGITLSAGNLSGRVPLDIRFLSGRLETLFENPAMLDGPLPESWFEQSQALYLATFLETEKVVEKTTALAEKKTNDPAVHFALYEALRARKKGSQALAALENAVDLDPAYALEYVALADTAREKNLPDKALEMLTLGQKQLPASAFLDLRRRSLLYAAGQEKKALELAAELSALPWSPVYYPEIKRFLSESLRKQTDKTSIPGG